MNQYYDLYPADVNNGGSVLISHVGDQDFILKYFDESEDRVRLRPRYADLACPRCKRLDPGQALSRGVDEAVVLRNRRRDLYESFEYLYVMSDRSVQTLRSVTDAVDYYPIPSTPGYSVAWPKLVIAPDPRSGAFEMDHPCTECGRYNNVVWGRGPILPPSDAAIGAFALASSQGVCLAWFGSQEVHDAIRQAKLKGWVSVPWRRPLK